MSEHRNNAGQRIAQEMLRQYCVDRGLDTHRSSETDIAALIENSRALNQVIRGMSSEFESVTAADHQALERLEQGLWLIFASGWVTMVPGAIFLYRLDGVVLAAIFCFVFYVPGAALAEGIYWLLPVRRRRQRLKTVIEKRMQRRSQEYRDGVDWLNRELSSVQQASRDYWGQQSYRPPDWKERREEVFGIHGKRCSQCGYPNGFSRKSRDLHIHHIRPLSQGGNNELENLIPLCDICHRDVDECHRHSVQTRRQRQLERKRSFKSWDNRD